MRQDSEPSCGLYIIKEGAVRIYALTAPDRENTIDYRSQGDTFGFTSIEGNRRPDVSVQAVSSVTCYVAGRSSVMDLLREHPELNEYLAPSYFPKRGEGVSPINPNRDARPEGPDRLLFTTPVRDLADSRIVSVRSCVSIMDAAALMSEHRVGAVVIMDETDGPIGIVTNTDLRDRVLLSGRDSSAPVSAIMSVNLVKVEGGDFCFEAAMKMISRDVQHLLVMDAGRPTGIFGCHNLLTFLVASPLMMAKEIENRTSIEGVAEASKKVMSLLTLLLGEGVGVESILRVITNVNDLIERKIIDLAVKTLGPPPMSFCWIVYGSAGRKEQTFKTDQDNAIIYGDPRNEEEARQAEEYFGRFAEFIVNAFLRCGFALCGGDFMATNPHWRRPLSVWKKYFSNWIYTPVDKAVYNAANLFDFRGLHGDMGLAAELKEHLMETLKGKRLFLKAMADLTMTFRPPIGLFGSFVVEKEGDYANQLDIKKTCLTPLINIIRLFSLECNIPETGTFERLAALKTAHPSVAEAGDDLAQAFEFISLLRIRRQWESASMGAAPDNYINPKRLNSLERKNLMEICRLISRLLDDIEKAYGGGMQL